MKMTYQKQHRYLESFRGNRPALDDNSLNLDIKNAILNILKDGPMCLSEIAIEIGYSTTEILKVLKEMSGVIEKRKYSFLKNSPDFQMWGISRPFKTKKKKS